MIRTSIILAAAWCLSALLRRRSAAERHLLWAAAILSAALLPVLTTLLPAWQPALAQRVADALPALTTVGAPGATGRSGVTFRVDAIESTETLARYWTVVWFAGAFVGLLFFGAGIIQQKRFAARSLPAFDPELEAMTGRFRRVIRLRRSLTDTMPMTWGIFRPVILLPKSADRWSEERKRLVLAHELAHVRRLDYFFQWVAQAACVVYWFNPLFWIAGSRLQRESEHACDDAVISSGFDARTYASHLLEVARAVQSASLWPATVAMARPSTLEKRFAALLKPRLNRAALSRKTMLAAAILTLSAVLPLAAMRFSTNRATHPDANPQIDQYITPPLYSDEARERRIEGVVIVQALIDVDGRPTHLEVIRGLGYGLDENALLAVRDWRFVPAMRNGGPVEAGTQIEVEFSLRTAELNEEIANDMATRIGPGVTPPQVVHRVEPQAGRSEPRTPAGTVVLDAVILEAGTAKIVRVIQSQGWQLDEAAINALKQWRFSPAMKDGEPVKVRMNIAVNFAPDPS
jgi:TonB family protein